MLVPAWLRAPARPSGRSSGRRSGTNIIAGNRLPADLDPGAHLPLADTGADAEVAQSPNRKHCRCKG